MPTYGLPADQKVLALIGTIALRHGQLENSLRRLLGELAGISANEALDATAFSSVRELRRRVRKHAKLRLGDGPLLLQLEALLERARRASDARNDLIHSTWGAEKGKVVVRNAKHEFVAMPSPTNLQECAASISAIAHELGMARLKNGFLYEALQKTKKMPKLDPDEDEE